MRGSTCFRKTDTWLQNYAFNFITTNIIIIMIITIIIVIIILIMSVLEALLHAPL